MNKFHGGGRAGSADSVLSRRRSLHPRPHTATQRVRNIPHFEESSRRSCLAAPHSGGGAGRDPSESYELSFLVRLAGRGASRALRPRDAAPQKTGRRRKTVALFSKTVPRTPTMPRQIRVSINASTRPISLPTPTKVQGLPIHPARTQTSASGTPLPRLPRERWCAGRVPCQRSNGASAPGGEPNGRLQANRRAPPPQRVLTACEPAIADPVKAARSRN